MTMAVERLRSSGACGRRARPDHGLEPGLGAGAAGEWAEDRQIDAGALVGVDAFSALLRRPGDTGGVDQRVADRALSCFMVAARPCRCNGRRLLAEAMLGHHAVVARKKAGIEREPRSQRIERFLAGG